MLLTPENAGDASQVIILGRGIEIQPGGEPAMSESTQQRADRAATYYFQHTGAFSRDEARLICSGGSPHLDGQDLHDVSEASLMADYLTEYYCVPDRLVACETESRSTLDNFVNSAQYIDLEQIDAHHPLGIVAQPAHLRRAIDVAHKVLGHETAIRGIGAWGESSLRMLAQEHLVMRPLWRGVLAGVPECDTGALLARQERLARVADRLRRPLSAIIR
jgi:hypothetical protein